MSKHNTFFQHRSFSLITSSEVTQLFFIISLYMYLRVFILPPDKYVFAVTLFLPTQLLIYSVEPLVNNHYISL